MQRLLVLVRNDLRDLVVIPLLGHAQRAEDQDRIEQLAPPQEIYDRPATQFVGRFISATRTSSSTATAGSPARPESVRVDKALRVTILGRSRRCPDGGRLGTRQRADSLPRRPGGGRTDAARSRIARAETLAAGHGRQRAWLKAEALDMTGGIGERKEDDEAVRRPPRRVHRRGFIAGGAALAAAVGFGRFATPSAWAASSAGRALRSQLGCVREPEDLSVFTDEGHMGLKIDPQNRPSGYEQYATFQPTFLYESIWDLPRSASCSGPTAASSWATGG